MLKHLRYLGILTIVLLCVPALSYGQFYSHFAGVGFTPGNSSDVFVKISSTSSYLSYIGNVGTTGVTTFFCPVDSLVDGTYLKEMSISYWDASATDNLTVSLKRMHLPSGTIQTVSTFTSNIDTAAWYKAHAPTAAGTKLISTAVWTYWLELTFSGGDSYLALAQVRLRYSY